MTKKKEFTDLRKKIIDAYEENEYANLLSNRNRARSLTVGTAFGGIIEVSMRGDYHSLWCTLQPVEAVELIEQIAASAGLEIAIRPRQDFATWRGWDTDADNKYWAGSAHWQVKQLQPTEEKEETDRKAIEGKKSLHITAGIEEEYRNELNAEIDEHIKNVFDNANEKIEEIRKEIHSELLHDEYEQKAEEETNNYYDIREKISQEDFE